ncbi:class I SAM-dependent methyltransferase [Hylemonella gracilis]|uniref:class I SAM-dependent methyltransferase n=1 Tax=Hylemonella gracilis TaxID=80880 RepID=UPI0013F16BCC|nr:class I SAM-dependent methyltransferase [Hylemonella gracilis]
MNFIANQPKGCPLCGSGRAQLHRWHSIADVRAEWKQGLGFDPFDRLETGDHLFQYRCLDCDMRFYHPAICGDGEFYKELSTRFVWYYEKDKWEFDVAADLISQLTDVRRLLEVGCGQGHFLTRMHNLYNCQGVEFNPKAIEDCQAKGLNVSSSTLRSIETSFDLVVAFEVLEHLSNPREFMEDALRVVKPNGYLLLAVPNPEGYFSEADRVLLDMPPHHVLSLSKKTFENIAKIFQLEIVNIQQEPLRFAHYKSYISNFILPDLPTAEKQPLLKRLMRRFLGIDLDVERRKVVEQLTAIQLATSYPIAKDGLTGQTHMVLFRKIA